MDADATLFFIISLLIFLGTLGYILYTNPLRAPMDQSSFGSPVPMSSMIGKSCPVGCTCFPKQDRSGTQMCAYLDNAVMFGCPPECCTPSCV